MGKLPDEVYIYPKDIEVLDPSEYRADIAEHFKDMPEVSKPLIKNAKNTLKKLESMLYTAPSFINAIKSLFPQEIYQAVLTNEQTQKIAEGALKLVTKKNGSVLATLTDAKTNKIVAHIPIKKVNLSPDISMAMTNFASQMQMAHIAEQIQSVQEAIEEVRQGQENDRLAAAYSCQQKLLQAMTIKNPKLRTDALLRAASDAEDSRNRLMLSQSANIAFIRQQPESMIEKIFSGASPKKIDSKITEIRESLFAVNMVSLAEAVAYQELGEPEAARLSMNYYADYIQKNYLATDGFVDRLDLIDPSPQNYWSKTLPEINKNILSLPSAPETELIEENI